VPPPSGAIPAATWAGLSDHAAARCQRIRLAIPRSNRWSRRSAAKFPRLFDASRERCWIADIDPAVCSIFLSAQARCRKLRLLLSIRRGAARSWASGCRRSHQHSRSLRLPQDPLWTQSTWLPHAKFIMTRFAGRHRPHRSFGQSWSSRPRKREL